MNANNQRKICPNCHFFGLYDTFSTEEVTLSISKETREKIKNEDLESCRNDKSSGKLRYEFTCYKGVWHQAPEKDLDEPYEKEGCFWPNYPRMAFETGRILQEKQEESESSSGDRKLTLWGLWIAVLALAVSAFLQLLEMVIDGKIKIPWSP